MAMKSELQLSYYYYPWRIGNLVERWTMKRAILSLFTAQLSADEMKSRDDLIALERRSRRCELPGFRSDQSA